MNTFKDKANAWKFNIERNNRDRRVVVSERSLEDGERANAGRRIAEEVMDVIEYPHRGINTNRFG